MYLSGTKAVGISAGGILGIVTDTNNVGTGQDGSILKYGNGAIPVPVGMIVDFAGIFTIPAGWIACYGQAVSRTGYPELFNLLSTTYGSGDGTTTFNLPDLRGRNVVGQDNMGGVAAGRVTTAGSGIDGLTIGAVGGGQSIVLGATNLPNTTIGVTVTITDPGHAHTVASSISGTALMGSGASFGSPNQSVSTSSNSTGITASGVTAALGSSTPAFSMNPSIIMRKMIFAGRP